MRSMTNKKIIELLKSGDFTIAYHDSGEPTLYKGRHKYDDLPNESIDFVPDYHGTNGYVPPLVDLLVKALGGKTDSI